MACRCLKITLISAKGLKNPHFVSEMKVYAVVTINGDPQTGLKTPVDKNRRSNPKWNYTIKLIVPEAAANQNSLNLVIVLRSDGVCGPKDIGKVSVPIKEFLGCKEKVSDYNVRLPTGKEKGTLTLSCKIGETFSVPVAAPPNVTEKGTSEETPVVRYPAAGSTAGYPTQPSVLYPHNPPQQPLHWCYPPPAQGFWYTGPLYYAPPGYIPAQQPAPPNGLVGSFYIVGMLSDILANFTSMFTGDMTEGLFDF